MRKYLVLVTILLMAGSALAFPVSIQTIDRTASLDDPAEFEVNVKNTYPDDRTFQLTLSSASPDSWVYHPFSKNISSMNNGTFNIEIIPPKTAIQQTYFFNGLVKTIEGEEKETFESYFTVDFEYDLAVAATSISGSQFRPGQKMKANITLRNTAQKEATGYEVRADFLNNSFKKTITRLPSRSRTVRIFNLEIPENATPGENEISLTILKDGEEQQSVSHSFQVLPVRNIEKDYSAENRLIYEKVTLSANNKGNSKVEAELNTTVPSYLVPLTSFEEVPDSSEETQGGTRYIWRKEVEAGKEASINYRTDYWPPFMIVGVLLAGIILLKRLHMDIEFTKSVRRTDEGIKVHLQIENKSHQEVKGLKIEDFVPDIASVSEDFPMAKPVIRKTNTGTRLTWEIDEMTPGEQRVFEYTIKPQIEVEGGAVLPAATLETQDRERETEEKEVEFRPE